MLCTVAAACLSVFLLACWPSHVHSLPFGLSSSTFRFYVQYLPKPWTTAFDADIEMHFGYKPLAEMEQGRKVSSDSAFWVSHWSRFYSYYLHTLVTSPLRVYDPALADAVFVPMCLGFCHDNTNAPGLRDLTHDTWFFGNASTLLPHLDSKPHFMIYNGYLRRHWFASTAEWRDVFSKRFLLIGLENPGFPNVVGAPHPSHEHFTPASRHFHRKSNFSAVYGAPRPVFVVGTYRDPYINTSRSAALISRLNSQCASHPAECVRNAPANSATIAQKLELYQLHYNATYSLVPPGDFLVLGELYDAVVSMSVPVVINWDINGSAAFTDMIKYDEFVLHMQVSNLTTFDVMQVLRQETTKAAVRARQRAMYSVRHVFQYTFPPVHVLVRFDERERMRPLDDAFTFTMKALLRSLCQRQLVPQSRCSSSSSGSRGRARRRRT